MSKFSGHITNFQAANGEVFTAVTRQGMEGFDDEARCSSARVTVRVLDVNDHRPVFADVTRTVSVAENVALGDVLFTVTASDADPVSRRWITGSNGELAADNGQ
jgi:hypothetical protein